MFNFKKNKIMTYTFNNLFDELFNDVYVAPTPNQGNYSINILEDGKQELIVNVVGHNPKNVNVDVTEDVITIKAETENVNAVVRNVNLKFKIGKDYDGTTSEASIENGILRIVMDKKEERKAKKLKIKF